MKKNQTKSTRSGPLTVAIPYLPPLIGKHASGREKAMASQLAKGCADGVVAQKVGCRSRAVRHFREHWDVPDLRQRSICRQMPFTIIQSFGVLGGTVFATLLMRRLPGMKLQGMAEASRTRQSFSAASNTTQTLAALESLLSEAAGRPQSDFKSLQMELNRSIAIHAEAKNYLPTEEPLERPISVMLLAGKGADRWERDFKRSTFALNWTVLRLTTIREIIAYLDCSVFSLYASRLWLGLEPMVTAAQASYQDHPPGLSCSVSAPGILRLIDGAISSKKTTKPGAALQPPHMHLRHFARSDDFLLQGRRDREPLYYTAKPWDFSKHLRKRASVAFALPYDLPESMELYGAPAWLPQMPCGVWIHEEEGERFIGAVENELLAAVARAIRSQSFKRAIRDTLAGQLGLRNSPLAGWCQSLLLPSSKRRRFSAVEIQLTAVYALLNFEVDFLMRHFDPVGQVLVKRIESQWQSQLIAMLNGFAQRIHGHRHCTTAVTVGDFLKVHRRPARFMLVNARRMAERICQNQVNRSNGTLPKRLDLLQANSRSHANKERELIEQTLREVELYAGIALAENQLRTHFVNYVFKVSRGEHRKTAEWMRESDVPLTRHSLDEAEDKRGKRLAERRMYNPENQFDDDEADEWGDSGFSGEGWSVLTSD